MENIGDLPGNPLGKIIQAAETNAVADAATATALPGALREVFSPTPAIELGGGKYKIRPFYDADWEILEALQHPIRNLKSGEVESYKPTGPDARMLAWLFTRPIKEVRETVRRVGIAGLRDLADDAFYEFGIGEHIAVSKAVYRQIELYWAPVIKYAADAADGEKKTSLTTVGT